MVTIDSAKVPATEKLTPFYKHVSQLSLMFLGVVIMLASATGLMMEMAYGTL